MKLKALTTAIIAILLANVALFATPDTRNKKNKRQKERLAAMLPTSDAVAVFDAKQLINTALPQILSADQQMLEHILGHIDLIKERTGIDLRKFDRAAVGVNYVKVSATETDYAPIVLAAAADFDFDALIAAAKLSTKGGVRTETIAGKQVTVFKIDPTRMPQVPNTSAKASTMLAKIASMEFAAVAIDRTTLAVGTLARVRETLEGKSRLNGDVATLLAGQEKGLLAFAMRPPGGMKKLLPLDSDELGKTIDSIKVIAGSLQVTAAGGTLHLVGRTATPGDALGLKDTLEVGQSFGKIAFAGKSRPDQMVYNRLINNARIDNKGTDVTVDVSIPQADIDVLIARFKK